MGIVVRQTDRFVRWYQRLRDLTAKIAIARRIERISTGNLGDCEPVGEGVSELRIDVGAGYRVYFVQRGKELVVLLCGGNKKSQSSDIKTAKKVAGDL
jgi:putative addiction module killer protein